MQDGFNDIGRRRNSDLTLDAILAAVRECDQRTDIRQPEARVYILRNFTAEGIEPFLKFHLYDWGVKPVIGFGGYDLVGQELTSHDSSLRRFEPDVVVLALVMETLDQEYGMPGWDGGAAIERLRSLYELASQSLSVPVIINTFVPPFYSEYSPFLPPDAHDVITQMENVNRFVREFVRTRSSRFILADWERWVRIVGEDKSMDYGSWYLHKAPFRSGFMNVAGAEMANAVRLMKGTVKKCIVLDCDNTLWGGVIGEDGLDGIKLDPHEYPGRVFYEFQRDVLHLVDRGIMVALCSKNNENDVWEVLDSHTGSLLHRKHLVGWKINWVDKATNIRKLAEELNIGLDSIVFVDDSPMECEYVKQSLPGVTALLVPKKLQHLPGMLFRSGLFGTLTLSDEDRNRVVQYQSEAQRQEEKAKHHDLDSFIASLELASDIRELDEKDTPRVAQLTQKTNQFNLTTRRYSEAEIAAMRASQDHVILTLRVTDKFGDYGLTGVFIARREGKTGIIDSLLLSCRILGRKLEVSFVAECLERLMHAWNVERWQAEYIPTKKNALVANFWEGVGFAATAEEHGRISFHAQPGTLHFNQ